MRWCVDGDRFPLAIRVKPLEMWDYIGCFGIVGLKKDSNFDLPIHSFNRICQTGGDIDINQD